MDLETENRIAAILLKQAAELRREAQKEGALAYLREPTVRCRPNSRFLTATVRGVQQGEFCCLFSCLVLEWAINYMCGGFSYLRAIVVVVL